MVVDRTLLSDKCPRCGKGSLIMDNATGEIFCGNCGYVITERIVDLSREWRVFDKEEYEERSRTGLPRSLAMYDMSLATVIDPIDKDASGRPLSTATRSTMRRLRTWDSRNQIDPLQRNLIRAFTELDKLKDKLAVSESIVEQTAYLYRKALEKGLIRGRSISALIAGALYTACRLAGTPRTLKDIAKASNVTRKDIARCYKLLVTELDLQIPVADPARFVSRIASRLGISERTKRTAVEILKKAEEANITTSKDPVGLAASALYLACLMHNEHRRQQDIAEVAGVTEVTIRNRSRNLKEIIANTTITTPAATTTVTTPTTTPSPTVTLTPTTTATSLTTTPAKQ